MNNVYIIAQCPFRLLITYYNNLKAILFSVVDTKRFISTVLSVFPQITLNFPTHTHAQAHSIYTCIYEIVFLWNEDVIRVFAGKENPTTSDIII